MSERANGDIAQLPAIKVLFDPATQQINLDFNATEFKDWHFVKAVLHGALSRADEIHKLVQMQAMQQQAMQQVALQQNMLRDLERGRR